MNKTFSVLSAAGLSLMLSACTLYGQADEQLVAEPDPLGLRLAAAVDKASSALETLASVEQARNPGASVQSVPYAPQELLMILLTGGLAVVSSANQGLSAARSIRTGTRPTFSSSTMPSSTWR